MVEVAVTLTDGLKLDGAEHKDAVLKEPTAGDIIDATIESERIFQTEVGPQIVASPTLTGINMLRRQIVNIGEIQGPLTLGQIRKLSAADLQTLQGKVEELDRLSYELEARGRDSASS